LADSIEAQIDEANSQILEEMEHWNELKVDPAEVVNINTVMLDAYAFALGSYLEELGVIDGKEFTLRFKVRLLENLRFHRGNVTPMVQEARRNAILRPNNRRNFH
jgi:hypothetical protein